MIHAVKTFPDHFLVLASGEKPFVGRKKDHLYKVGDYLTVNEFVPDEQVDIYSILPKDFRRTSDGYYTGDCLIFRITYILDDPEYCAEGTVILGLRKVYFVSNCKNERFAD